MKRREFIVWLLSALVASALVAFVAWLLWRWTWDAELEGVK